MQLSKLKPETRLSYLEKKIIVNSALLKGEAILQKILNNKQAVVKFIKPIKPESNLRLRSELRAVSINVKYLFI